jgi:hypothetical protein
MRITLAQALVMLEALSGSTRIFRLRYSEGGETRLVRCRFNVGSDSPDSLPHAPEGQVIVHEYGVDARGYRTVPLDTVVALIVSGTEYVISEQSDLTVSADL